MHQLAFAPLLFQAAMSARNMGVLETVHAAGAEGSLAVEVAERTGLTLYSVRVLLEGCEALQLVVQEARRYRLTDAGQLWLSDKMTRINANFVQDICYRGAFHLEESLRTGRPAGLAVFGDWPTIYAGLTQLPPAVQTSWFEFDHFYSDGSFPFLFEKIFARPPRKLLDVGGNTGKWAAHCLASDPEVEVTVLDHPGQLERLRDTIARAGFSARLRTVAMDLREHDRAFPTGFDAVCMSQFLDCFPEPDIIRLLERGRAALAPAGRLYVMESFVDRQPNDVAELCLQGLSLYFACMANGDSRMYHSQDMLELVERAGLRVEADDAIGLSSTLLTCVAR